MEIRAFDPSLAADAVAVYNWMTARTPYCYPLTPDIFAEAVTDRKEFNPEGFFIAYAGGRPQGLIHAWTFERNGATGGSILLFLAQDRLVCRELLAAALDHMKRRGARSCEVMGNAPGSHFFYRGVHLGFEVCLWRGYYAAINALERAGFDLVCDGFFMSRQLDGDAGDAPPPEGITLAIRPGEDAGSFYTNARVEARLGDEPIGGCRFHLLKRLSAHLGRGIGQITIGIDEKHHRRKIGSALLARAHGELFRLGARTVILATNHELYPAIRMYEKLGYRKEVAELRVYAGDFDELHGEHPKS